ncbi:hypothetical protein LTR16_011133, partial [Cryomyces antarcticus]
PTTDPAVLHVNAADDAGLLPNEASWIQAVPDSCGVWWGRILTTTKPMERPGMTHRSRHWMS